MAKHIINCTPKWENLLPMFFQWLECGVKSQKECAKIEIKRLAKMADTFMEHREHGGLTCKCGETFDLT
jgi:hypothetical protein